MVLLEKKKEKQRIRANKIAYEFAGMVITMIPIAWMLKIYTESETNATALIALTIPIIYITAWASWNSKQ